MGSSPSKMSAFKATAEELKAEVEANVPEGRGFHEDIASGRTNSDGTVKTDEKAYGGTKTWKEGQEDSGGNLNDWARKGKTLEKGSREWNINQNKINEALGSKKRYDVAEAPVVKENKLTGRTKTTTGDKDPNTGADRVTTTTTRKDGTTAKVKSETDDKKTVSKTSKDGSKQKNVVKTGLSTDTKADDVKTITKIKGGDNPTQNTKTKTADTVTKTETDLKTGEETKSKTRKRLGKGLIKDVVAKAKAKKEAKKAGKVDSSEMPT